MEALGLNEKSNKSKGKAVEKKKKSGMKIALNAFKKGGRERENRGRGERCERGRGAEGSETVSKNKNEESIVKKIRKRREEERQQ
jgi:hypothetical protein